MNDIYSYLDYVKNSPKNFLYDIEKMSNETLLLILLVPYNSDDMELFRSIINYCGQESINYDIIHPYNKILSVLRDKHMYAFKYVCKHILPPILNYQIENNKQLIPVSLINISTYPEYLSNCIKFIEDQEKLEKLMVEINNKKELKNHIIQSLNLYDKDLASYLQNFKDNNNIHKLIDNSNSNNILEEKDELDNLDNEIDLEEFQNDNNNEIINETFNDNMKENENISVNENENENENMSVDENMNTDYNLYLQKIKKENDDSIRIVKIDNDFLVLKINNLKEKDGLELFKSCINQDILYKVSKKKIEYLNLDNLEPILRDKRKNKNIILCDGMDVVDNYSANNDDYEIELYDDSKNSDKKIKNLEAVINFFKEFKYEDQEKSEQQIILKDKYSVVLIIQNDMFDKLFGASSDEDVNMSKKDNIIFISLGNNLEYEYLLIYLFVKLRKDNDILVTNKNYEFLNNNLKSYINGEMVDLKQIELEKVKNLDFLSQKLNNKDF